MVSMSSTTRISYSVDSATVLFVFSCFAGVVPFRLTVGEVAGELPADFVALLTPKEGGFKSPDTV